MNNIVGMFTGMDGRIGRQQWWIGAVILIVVNLVLSWILGTIMGTGMSFGQPLDPAAMQASLQRAGWSSLIVLAITAYPYIAIGVKRRHDKDNNGMDAIGFVILLAIYDLLLALGLSLNILGTIVGIVFLIYAIYMLVVLGFLKGTTGPNQYGPDPLGGA